MTSPLFYKLQCPDCGGKFRWPFGDPEPLYCPLCAAYVGDPEPEEFTPKAPMIRTVKAQIPDKVFRDMERASIDRAEQAREIAGGDRSDYSHMHITDLKDNMREGDVAAVTRPNPVQRFMTQHPQAPVGIQGAPSAQGYAAMAHTGAYPFAGAKAVGKVQEIHHSLTTALQSAGQLNK